MANVRISSSNGRIVSEHVPAQRAGSGSYPLGIETLLARIPADWRVGSEKLPIDNGPRWSWWARPHAADGFQSDWHDTAVQALRELVGKIERREDHADA